jgi:hypothetical protein
VGNLCLTFHTRAPYLDREGTDGIAFHWLGLPDRRAQ